MKQFESLAVHHANSLRTVRRRPIGEALDPKRNSLNFLRLVLAFCVVYSHAAALAWLGYRDVDVNDTQLATIAIYGFFGISGYLIAGSAMRNSVGRYLWQRFLRIFPAFWVCLVVTSFVLGAIGLAITPAPHCGYVCYLKLHPGPLSFVYSNGLLKINQNAVALLGRRKQRRSARSVKAPFQPLAVRAWRLDSQAPVQRLLDTP